MKPIVSRALVVMIVAGVGAGADYYVAPDGLDTNPGTLAQPFRNPIPAAAKLMPGDTLYFRAGTYRCRTSGIIGLAPSRSGEEGKPITFKNYNNEHVKIDGGGSDWGFTPNGYSYIVIDGFEITNSGHYGMKISANSGGRGTGHHVTVRNCEVHGSAGECIFAHSTPYLTIENCHLHHSSRSHGLYMQVGCHNAVIRHVTSEDNHGNSGTQLNAAGGGIKNALVEFCLLRRNAQGWSLMGVQDSVFRHNVLYNNGYDGPRGSGRREIILWTYAEGGKPGTICENNTFENNTVVNLVPSGHLLNNLVQMKSGTRNITWRNNIFYVREKPIFTLDDFAGSAFFNNCFFVVGSAPQVTGAGALDEFAKAKGLKCEGNRTADALFVDVEKGDLTLKDGSPCLDAGANTDSRVPSAGKGRDIGAFERGATMRIGCDLPWRK